MIQSNNQGESGNIRIISATTHVDMIPRAKLCDMSPQHIQDLYINYLCNFTENKTFMKRHRHNV